MFLDEKGSWGQKNRSRTPVHLDEIYIKQTNHLEYWPLPARKPYFTFSLLFITLMHVIFDIHDLYGICVALTLFV